jgi:predicted permease
LTFSIVPLQEHVVGGTRRSVILLVWAVAFVLLIACANVANLLLSRALERQREMAVRAAIGATRMRLVGQLLAESLLLAMAGGLVGVTIAVGALHAIRTLGTRSVPRLPEISIDTHVLFFTLAISVLSGVLFGLVPALRLSRAGSRPALKDAARGASAGNSVWGRGNHVRRVLVIGELALSVMLLVAAGLLLRSFARLQQEPTGFNRKQVLTLELTMMGRKYADSSRVRETYRQLFDGLARLPGVTAAGGVSMLPLSQMFAWGPIVVEGRPLPSGASFVNVDQRTVGADYFRVMQIALLKGRLFTNDDTPDTSRIVIVDDHMAQTLWPNENAIGKRLRRGGMDSDAAAPWLSVVGIVGRIKQYSLDERDSRMAMYLPHAQNASRAMNVVIRTTPPPATLTSAASALIRSVDPDLPIYNVRTMEERVDESLAQRRFAMMLLAVFAGVALALAGIGVYGVMACLVSQGTRDIGIRLALGATPRAILSMVMRHGIIVALVGTAAGLLGAVIVTRALESMLFGVDRTDLMTFVTVSALLAAVAAVGTYLPARRATRTDPSVCLRSE